MQINNSKVYFIVLFFLSVILLFSGLTNAPIQLWDESRLATNALEMVQNGNIIVTYFDGSPDMWNTKPPLMIWLMAISMKAFGFNEFAVRFPSAIASLCTVLFVYYIVSRQTNSPISGLCSGLVLLSSMGYMDFHVTRTGDYDALLTLWITLYSLYFYKYLSEDSSTQTKNLLLFFLSFVLAILTKGIAGAMMIPALLIYILISKNFFKVATDRKIYIFGILSLIVIFSYYYLREIFNSGYLQAVNENEIGGRFGKVIEAHAGPFSFYWDYFISKRYNPWIYILPISALVLFFDKNTKLKNLALYSGLCSIVFFLIISSAKTKLNWYDAPVYPFLAILTGCGIASFISNLLVQRTNKQYEGVLGILSILFIFYLPFTHLLNSEIYKTKPKDTLPVTNYRTVLEEIGKEKPGIKAYYLISENYDASLSFYEQIYNLRGYQLVKKKLDGNFQNGDILLTLSPAHTDAIATMYNVEPLITKENSYSLVKIKSKTDISYPEIVFERRYSEIIHSPEMRNYVRQKALNNNISFKEALIGDAFYMAKNDTHISEEEENKIKLKYNNQ